MPEAKVPPPGLTGICAHPGKKAGPSVLIVTIERGTVCPIRSLLTMTTSAATMNLSVI
tara:strand:- start:159 stop:332 length:174 start_codon:yes stop_codon:yes gene_type:complete